MGEPIDWQAERRSFAGIPGDGFNLAWEAVEARARDAHASDTALRLVGSDGGVRAVSFGELAREVRRCAAALRQLGLRKGDTVFLVLERSLELVTCFFGALECGAIVAPLHASYGPEAVRSRLSLGRARILVTGAASARRLRPLFAGLPGLAYVIAVEEPDEPAPPGTLGYHGLLARAPAEFAIERTREEDPALLHFTSGTAGLPRGTLHVHGVALAQRLSARMALDLSPGDVFWGTPDPGWGLGTACALVGPLLAGATSVVDAREFEARRAYRLVAEQRVGVWLLTAAELRALVRAGEELARAHDLSSLRLVACTGEWLPPELVRWGERALGLPIHDLWGQTETGTVLIANVPALPVRPGSMGKPLPGTEACLVRREPGGGLTVLAAGEGEGELALRGGTPALFRAYLDPERREPKGFVGDLYLTGDLARRDADGYYWFVGRATDAIRCAGRLVGPVEVERVLGEHPAVAEVAVIGKPDPELGERVKAFVALKHGGHPSETLRAELLAFGGQRLPEAVAPRELEFRPLLPRTRNGMLLRRVLRTRELGLAAADPSELDDPT